MGRPSAAEFSGTERYGIVRRLGCGAMGVVYEVHDRECDTRVALEHLRRSDPAWLLQFKQEFRALADVSHPNLVTLYELVAAENQWFFTMELVGGGDFPRYVRFGARELRVEGGEALAETIAPPVTPGNTPASSPGSSGASGRLMALHEAAAKRRRGQLLGGDEGRALISEADQWMRRQNIAKPERMPDVIAPGFHE